VGGKVALEGGNVLYRPLELLYHPLEKNFGPAFFFLQKTRETAQTTPNFMLSPFLRSKLVHSLFLNWRNITRLPLPWKHAFKEEDFRRQITNTIPV
jgi:hypothetical protein